MDPNNIHEELRPISLSYLSTSTSYCPPIWFHIYACYDREKQLNRAKCLVLVVRLTDAHHEISRKMTCATQNRERCSRTMLVLLWSRDGIPWN